MTSSTSTDAVSTAAERLLDAARTAAPCRPVRTLLPDGAVGTGYAIQSLLTRARLAEGRSVAGRKIGLTSLAVQTQLEVDQPELGVPFDDMVCDQRTPIDIGRLLQPRVEAEIAFVLGADLDHDGIDETAARAAVAEVVPALEIVDSRIAGWDITIVDTVADNASSGLYVLGDDRHKLGDTDLREVAMTLTGAGERS